jgi:hypothetical protein
MPRSKADFLRLAIRVSDREAAKETFPGWFTKQAYRLKAELVELEAEEALKVPTDGSCGPQKADQTNASSDSRPIKRASTQRRKRKTKRS